MYLKARRQIRKRKAEGKVMRSGGQSGVAKSTARHAKDGHDAIDQIERLPVANFLLIALLFTPAQHD